ncbi:MAG: ion channel [Cytophagales bacterium]|jgi:inward rectifier potassium channel|nr:ion channel [Cytophagales bacterium]
MRRRNTPKEETRELGFGSRLTENATRLINRDGTFNVVRSKPLLERFNFDLYHRFITMSWGMFFLKILAAVLFINCLFACLYLMIGIDKLSGVAENNVDGDFWDAFFFSAQSLTTVGYGQMSPMSWGMSMVAACESMVGWLMFAVASGLFYGRFSRPAARMLYSEHGIFAPYKDRTAFMFRIANARDNQLIEVETELTLSMVDHGDGTRAPRRRYYRLKLELERINLLSLSWTIVHPIDADSPLYGLTLDDLKAADAEFLVFIKAFDDTFSQTVYHRSSYYHSELLWGAKFKPMYFPIEQDTKIRLELDKISEVEAVALPEPVLETEEEERSVSDL